MPIVALIEITLPVLIHHQIAWFGDAAEDHANREILVMEAVMLRRPVHVPEVGTGCHRHQKPIARVAVRAVEVAWVTVKCVEFDLVIELEAARCEDRGATPPNTD